MESKDQQEDLDFRVQAVGDNKIAHLHNRYELASDQCLFPVIDSLISHLKKKEKGKTRTNLYELTKYSYFPSFQFLLLKVEPQTQLCCICQFEYQLHQHFDQEVSEYSPTDIVSIGRCQHLFHLECLTNFVGLKQFMKCPVCSCVYGVITGDQPEGTMSFTYNKRSLEGYQGVGTITVQYNMNGGTRNQKQFGPTRRTGYLPHNAEGEKVLRLLQTAFKRKLTFTVGRSVTTGAQNVIVWNGIHHKTSPTGGSCNFGYPDPTYLLRVAQQLAAKGIY